DHDEEHEGGHDTVPGQVREAGGLQAKGHHDDDQTHECTQRSHPIFPSARTSARSEMVAAGTTTPTTSRAEKFTKGTITARWLCSRTLAKTSATCPTGTPGTYGPAPSLPQVTTVSPLAGTNFWSSNSRSSRPSCPRTPLPLRKPTSIDSPIRPPTTDSGSRTRSTVAVWGVTRRIRPT